MTTERVHLAGDDEDDLYSGFDVNDGFQVSPISHSIHMTLIATFRQGVGS